MPGISGWGCSFSMGELGWRACPHVQYQARRGGCYGLDACMQANRCEFYFGMSRGLTACGTAGLEKGLICQSKHVIIKNVEVGVMVTPCDCLRACRYYVISSNAIGSSKPRRIRYYAASCANLGSRSATPMQRVTRVTCQCADIVLRNAML